MAHNQTITHYRTTGTAAPDPSTMSYGELAVSYNNDAPKLYIKKVNDTIAEFVDKNYVDGKQDALTPGRGIEISEENEITCSLVPNGTIPSGSYSVIDCNRIYDYKTNRSYNIPAGKANTVKLNGADYNQTNGTITLPDLMPATGITSSSAITLSTSNSSGISIYTSAGKVEITSPTIHLKPSGATAKAYYTTVDTPTENDEISTVGGLMEAIAAESGRSEGRYVNLSDNQVIGGMKTFTDTINVSQISSTRNNRNGEIIYTFSANTNQLYVGSQNSRVQLRTGDYNVTHFRGGTEYIVLDTNNTKIATSAITVNGTTFKAVTSVNAGTGISISGGTSSAATIGLDSTLLGTASTTTLANLPVYNRIIVAEVNSTQNLTFASLPADGLEIHVIIHNTGSAVINVPLPEDSTYICTSVNQIYIAAGKYAEVSLISAGGKGYVRGASSV